jgi:hypothetical protein
MADKIKDRKNRADQRADCNPCCCEKIENGPRAVAILDIIVSAILKIELVNLKYEPFLASIDGFWYPLHVHVFEH